MTRIEVYCPSKIKSVTFQKLRFCLVGAGERLCFGCLLNIGPKEEEEEEEKQGFQRAINVIHSVNNLAKLSEGIVSLQKPVIGAR